MPASNAPDLRRDLASLCLRIMCGVAMMLHGAPKIANPFHWMDKAQSPAPALFQGLAALAEFGGGLGLVLGLLTSLSAFGIACTMSFALWMHASRGDPFVKPGGPSYEPALFYLVAMLSLLLLGPGRYALDARFARGRAR